MNIGNVLLSKSLDFLCNLQDPYLVSKFQNYFGVYRSESHKNGESNGECINMKQYDKIFNSSEMRTEKCNSVTKNAANGIRRPKKCSFVEDDIKNSPPSTDTEELLSDIDSDQERKIRCHIENKFWYYFFSFGAGLGYEMFYASFFPFWIWNIDGAVCRRVIIVWVLIMYVGQAMKDIICWPRPSSPPVIQLEPGYIQEYGMPSTHAMVGAAVPFSLLFFTMYRYEYPFIVGLLLATAWCILVCCSRLYMGMHTILDIIGGLVLVAVLMMVIIPFSDVVDHFQLTNPYSPLVTVGVMVILLVIYPDSGHWTPARGDTAIIMGTGAGFAIGSWLNFRQGVISGPGLPPPYQILWPDYGVLGLALLRASIGILCVVATRAIFKSITYAIICYFLRLDPRDLKSKQKIVVEIPYKFITYLSIGFVITYIAPFVFRLLNIERITMFTEV